MPSPKTAKTRLIDVVGNDDADEGAFSGQLESELERLGASGLFPSSALRLLTFLIMESASADKAKIEKLKMMDKLLNTGRALMETSIKHEETTIILDRLEQLESRLEQLRIKGPAGPSQRETV